MTIMSISAIVVRIAMHERASHHRSPDLPPDLVNALRAPTYACLTVGTEQGTAFVIKAPTHEIESVRGHVPVHLTHELYDHPNAPVIRMTLHIYDDPLAPLAMESFINVADAQQRADYAALANQREIALLFYDEALQHRLSKRISHTAGPIVPDVLATADAFLARIPAERFSFELAKAAVQEGRHP